MNPDHFIASLAFYYLDHAPEGARPELESFAEAIAQLWLAIRLR